MVDESTTQPKGSKSLLRHMKMDRWPLGPRSLAFVAVAGLALGTAMAPSFADTLPTAQSQKKALEAAKKAQHKADEAAKKAGKDQGGAVPDTGSGACTEDAFVSQVIPSAGTPVNVGSTIGVTYD